MTQSREEASADFVASRRVGDATVTIISWGSLTLPHSAVHQARVPEDQWRPVMPDADSEGMVPHASTAVHIAIGDACILVDTAPRENLPAEIAADPSLIRSPGLVAGLARIGVTPEQITHVLFTHAHGDHLGGVVEDRDGLWVPRFTGARHLLNRHDWDENPDRANPDSQLVIRLGPIERAGLLELVEGDYDVVPGVRMIHAPGESPGHAVVRVESSGQVFYALGDLIHHPCNVAYTGWLDDGFVGRDADLIRISRERILGAAAAERALLTYTHVPFPPRSPFGRAVWMDAGLRWEPV